MMPDDDRGFRVVCGTCGWRSHGHVVEPAADRAAKRHERGELPWDSECDDPACEVRAIRLTGENGYECELCTSQHASRADALRCCTDRFADVDDGLRADGGMRRSLGGETLAGVGDQDATCINGTPGCPGPNAGGGLPCIECFGAGGDGDE